MTIRLAILAGLMLSFLLSPFGLMAQYRVVHLEKPYNTAGSETGALRIGDTVLAYSSMQPSSGGNSQFGWNNAQMQVMQARISKSGKLARPRPCRWGLNNKKDHTGNLAQDPLTHDLYFTRARVGDPTLRCDIWWARKLKRGWTKPQRLGGAVNLKEYTSTQPSIGRLNDSTVVLYFSSDRPGGLGGMDIWYAIVRNGSASEPVNLGPMVNSPADEITPFYDQPNGALYFSSDRMGGQGGYDIYCAQGQRNTWAEAHAVCGCLNSGQNDIYFTVTDHDPATGMPTGGYLSSNRPDSYFLVDSTCCNDIYRWGIDTALLAERVVADTVENIDTIAQRVRRFMFPLFLYFHNDEPDPMSRLATTESRYEDCQRRYASLRGEYVQRQTSADDSAMMQEFFDSCVEGNYRRIEELLDYVESLLDADHGITLTIAGYASPVFHSEYNQVLSERRIGSFINMIRAWRGGLLADAMDDGRLRIEQRPHGAVEPTTESRSTDPVYGLPAALARRIEILSCEIF